MTFSEISSIALMIVAYIVLIPIALTIVIYGVVFIVLLVKTAIELIINSIKTGSS